MLTGGPSGSSSCNDMDSVNDGCYRRFGIKGFSMSERFKGMISYVSAVLGTDANFQERMAEHGYDIRRMLYVH